MTWSANITFNKNLRAQIGSSSFRGGAIFSLCLGVAGGLFLAATDPALDDSNRAYYFLVCVAITITIVLATLLGLALVASVLRTKQLKDMHGTRVQSYELTKKSLKVMAGKDVMELALDDFRVARATKSGIFLKRGNKRQEYYLFFDSEDEVKKVKKQLEQWQLNA